MGIFNLFGSNTSVSLIEEYLEKNAIVIDVREFLTKILFLFRGRDRILFCPYKAFSR